MRVKQGLFITLEGGDGVGKSTQAELLASWLEEQGRIVRRTREPGGTSLGRAIRALLLEGDEPVDPRAEALLYAADRAHHVATVVRPALAEQAVVIQDRYIDSSLAYQGAGRTLDVEAVRTISTWATETLQPDVTILLDLPASQAMHRRDGTGKAADRLEREKLAFHEAVRQQFLLLAQAEPDRFLVLDASQSPAALHGAIRKHLVSRLKS